MKKVSYVKTVLCSVYPPKLKLWINCVHTSRWRPEGTLGSPLLLPTVRIKMDKGGDSAILLGSSKSLSLSSDSSLLPVYRMDIKQNTPHCQIFLIVSSCGEPFEDTLHITLCQSNTPGTGQEGWGVNPPSLSIGSLYSIMNWILFHCNFENCLEYWSWKLLNSVNPAWPRNGGPYLLSSD